VLALIVGIAFGGRYLAPHGPRDIVGRPFSNGVEGALLGTDFVGQDVLSRVLYGGANVVLLAIVATILAYAIGTGIGLLAAYRPGRTDSLLMRTVDILVSLPLFVIVPVLVLAIGPGVAAIILGVSFVETPSVSRVVRAAASEVMSHDYVETAVASGESPQAVMWREVFPNVLPTIGADLGYRLIGVVFLIAALNFIGLGLGPSTIDWALMINENRSGITSQPWAVAAPALALMTLTISVNLAFGRSRRSTVATPATTLP
jgi:peptide/nickel transport system permease protein